MTQQERANLEVVANDVKWIREQLEDYCKKTANLERLVYIGLGICIMGEIWIGWLK
jgi:hypothetical protein